MFYFDFRTFFFLKMSLEKNQIEKMGKKIVFALISPKSQV